MTERDQSDWNQLSINTTAYLQRYYMILNEMIRNMTSVQMTDSISGSFIVQMIPHHRGAIEMSKNLLRYTTNIPLQTIAQNIIVSQTKSIENMMAIYPGCRYSLNTQEELLTYRRNIEAILSRMFDGMAGAQVSNSIDVNFIREMIPHHEGAVRMSELALSYPLCPELVPVLNAIVTSQKMGIRQLQQLLAELTRPC